MNETQPPRELYPRLLGDAWGSLPSPVRRAHTAGGKLHGRFRVTWGGHAIARQLARWSRLPEAADDAETELRICRDGEREHWHRRFDGVAFTTAQWMGRDGYLVEQFNAWELEFALHADGRSLVYEPRRARLCIGPLRLRVPLVLAPCVRAKETGIGTHRVDVVVGVSLPLIGLLIAYQGHLNVEEPRR